MTHGGLERGQGLVPAVLLTALIILAAVLRFHGLGDWTLQATEIFTLRDSLRPQFNNSRPLGYLLNYYLVRPFLPLDEFGLRLLPAIFGVLGIPALYLVGRRLVGPRAALLGAFLLALSPVHVSDSQLARYWSLVFLGSAIYPYALYLGVRDRNGAALALGVVMAIVSALAHPVSLLLLGGVALYLAAGIRREQLAHLWSQRAYRWAAAGLVVAAAVIAWRFIPLLQGWISAHDRNPGSGQFLLRPKAAPGVKQIVYLTAYMESLTVPVVLSAAAGLYAVWRGRDRSLALYLACLAIFPMAFLALISLRTPVSTYYLLPTAPVFFLGAGVFLDRLFDLDWKLHPAWLFPAAVTTMVALAGVPTLISDHRDGRRYDFRGVADWLQTRLTPGDHIVSDQPMVLAHYLEGREVQRLRYDTGPLEESVRAARAADPEGALWIVAPAPSHGFRTNLRKGGLARWMYDNCQLRNTIGVGRVDFRQQYLQVYRCPPTGAPGSVTPG
jgi:mannosyltransferase